MNLSLVRSTCVLAAILLLSVTGALAAPPDPVSLPFEDGFEGATVGAIPKDWRAIPPRGGSRVVDARAHDGKRSLKVEGSGRVPGFVLVRLPELPDVLVYEVSVFAGIEPDRRLFAGFFHFHGKRGRFYNAFVLERGNRAKGVVKFRGTAKARPEIVGAFTSGKWVTLKARLDFKKGSARLWVDGKLVLKELRAFPRKFADRLGPVILDRWCVKEPNRSGKPSEIHIDSVRFAAEVKVVEDVPSLIERLGDDEPSVRSKAALELGERKDRSAVMPLVTCLGDEDPGVRKAAWRALVKIGPASVNALVGALRGKRRVIRRAAAEILKHMRWRTDSLDDRAWYLVALGFWSDARKLGPAAFEPIADALEDVNPLIRARAASELGSLGSRGAVQPLIERLEDEAPSVRSCAAAALGELADARAVTPLIRLLGDPGMGVRARAAKALGILGDDRAIGPLRQAFRESNQDVKDEAGAALGRLGAPVTDEPLNVEHLLARGGSEQVARLGSGAVAPTLEALGSPDRRVRSTAVDALGLLGDRRAVEPLISILRGPDEKLRLSAIVALGRLKDERAVVALAARLTDLDPTVRRFAMVGLARIGGDRAVEEILPLLEVPEARLKAAGCLAFMKHPKGLEVLLAALRNEDAEVRLAAVDELGGLRDKATVAPLVGALKDPDLRVASCAAESLGSFDRADVESVIPALVDALERDEFLLLARAGKALGRLGWKPETDAHRARLLVARWRFSEAAKLGAAAVPPLVAALEFEHPRARYPAARALGGLGPVARDAVPALRRLAADEKADPVVRMAALAAVEAIAVK